MSAAGLPGRGNAADPGRLRVLGVRHHGPGSARAVRRVLQAYRPEVVLIEGPPEADSLVKLVGDAGMVPPVALLAYAPEAPGTASFWPFAVFSPEWQALTWAVEAGVPVRFCDLPAGAMLAARTASDAVTDLGDAELGDELPGLFEVGDGPARNEEGVADEADSEQADAGQAYGGQAGAAPEGPGLWEPDDPASDLAHSDPLAVLARLAGYDDPERWWDDVMELQTDGDPFDAIAEAMAALRAGAPPVGRTQAGRLLEQRREAWMRKVLRAELRTGRRVAVVCGAWHVPALTGRLPTVAADNAVLKGLPKRKVTLTWVPWAHSRLATASGYGAGVASPGWYHHLFTAEDHPVSRWLTEVARVLRAHDLAVSSAHVVEAVRLADALAALRDRPLAGLTEMQDATLAVLCDGNPAALGLVTAAAVTGERFGSVPESAPGVPLEADLRAYARRLRLKFELEPRELTLDLRRTTDLERSRLLHRLGVLGVAWGVQRVVTGEGTFKEGWTLRWEPEFVVAVVEASLWGTTVAGAATARLLESTGSLAEVTTGVEAALRADLADALPGLLTALDAHAAADTDVAHLLDAFPALVRSRRYGDVRGTATDQLITVTEALFIRICAGLPTVAGALSAEAARALVDRIDAVQDVLPLLGDPAAERRWVATALALADRADVTGLLAGRLVRMLTDAGTWDTDEAARRLSRALSRGSGHAAEQAAWVEGFLAGGALLLIHDDRVLGLVDAWVRGLDDEDFLIVLPLVRRTFGAFELPERRNIARRARRIDADRIRRDGRDADDGTGSNGIAPDMADWGAQQRVAAALATVDWLLGPPDPLLRTGE
ncbi:MAG: DUF5682 family protein [Propionibacteriaceae bacterium]|nr:DUF5682 family protein [Propionibacteriaceae bacterium]